MTTKHATLFAVASALACLCCSTSQPKPLEVRSGKPGTATVVGRIQVYKDGDPQYVGPRSRPLVGWIEGPRPLTDVALRERASGKRESISVEDADGWFVAHLAPGRYGMGMRYYIWLFDTPSTFEVKQADAGYCIGTLHVDLAANRSFGGAVSEAVGGAVPMGDNAFAVGDDCATAPGSLDKALMKLDALPRNDR